MTSAAHLDCEIARRAGDEKTYPRKWAKCRSTESDQHSTARVRRGAGQQGQGPLRRPGARSDGGGGGGGGGGGALAARAMPHLQDTPRARHLTSAGHLFVTTVHQPGWHNAPLWRLQVRQCGSHGVPVLLLWRASSAAMACWFCCHGGLEWEQRWTGSGCHNALVLSPQCASRAGTSTSAVRPWRSQRPSGSEKRKGPVTACPWLVFAVQLRHGGLPPAYLARIHRPTELEQNILDRVGT